MKFILYISAVFFLIVVLLVLAEISFRLIRSFKRNRRPAQLLTAYSKEYYQSMSNANCWKYIPLQVRTFFPLAESQSVIKSNTHGFRTSEFDFSSVLNTRNVILLGGSQTWGLGATADSEVVSVKLEALLNSKPSPKPWKVYNLSMMAATSQQELLYLVFWGLKLKPEFVISVTGFNDTHFPTEYFDKKNQLFTDVATLKAYEQYTAESEKANDLGFIVHRSLSVASELYRFIVSRRTKGSTQSSEPLVDILKERSQTLLRHLDVMSKLSQSFGAEYLGVLQPVCYGKKQLGEIEKQQQEYFTQLHANAPIFRSMVEETAASGSVFRWVNQYKKEGYPQIKLHDLSSVFDSSAENIFADGITHLNDLGHEQLAKKLVGLISDSKR